MNMRELKGLEIAARNRIVRNDDGTFTVPSQSGNGTYRVNIWASPSCSCPDFELTQKPCKHVHAAQLVAERDGLKAPAPIVVDAVPKKKQYPQNWPLYNLAQYSGPHCLDQKMAILRYTFVSHS